MSKKHQTEGITVAIGCFIIMFIHLGTLGTAGLFIPQLIKELQVPVSQVSLNVTFSSLTGFVFSLLVGKLRTKFPARNLILIGSIAGVLHYFISGLASGVLFIYLGSLIGGIKFGFGTHTCHAMVISQWFTHKKATILGIVFSGAALGSAVMMYASGVLIDWIGWRSTYMLFAAMHLFIAIPVNFMMLKDTLPEEAHNKEDIIKENGKVNPVNKAIENTVDNALSTSPSTSYKTAPYWMLMCSMMLCGTLIIGFKTFVPSFWQANGMSPLLSSQYISLFMIAATLATSISGNIADKFGNRAFIVYLHTAFLLGIVGVLIFTNAFSKFQVLAPLLLVAVAYPLYGSLPATVTLEAFGMEHYDKICGELMGAFFIGQATVSPIIGGLRDITGTYTTGFMVIGIFGLFSCLLIIGAIRIAAKSRKGTIIT